MMKKNKQAETARFHPLAAPRTVPSADLCLQRIKNTTISYQAVSHYFGPISLNSPLDENYGHNNFFSCLCTSPITYLF